MTQIQVDQALQQRLGGLGESLELCGPDGRVIGRYLPESEYRRILYGTIQVPLSEEEISRRRAEAGGCSLDQIWKRVGRS
jgi:hypothetical protein